MNSDVSVTTTSGMTRRRALQGLGMAAAAAGPVLASNAHAADATQACPTPETHRQDYLGEHQAGIITPRPLAGLMASCDIKAPDRAALVTLFKTLTQRIAVLTQGEFLNATQPEKTPQTTGILSPGLPENLTVTVSVGSSLFDKRYGLQAAKPRHLQPMTRHPNDDLDPRLCHGDLSLQFCADTPDANVSALLDILHHAGPALAMRWLQAGSVAPTPTPAPGQLAASSRNLMGFLDGSANPDSGDAGLMNDVVWVSDAHKEPAWAKGGSYQAVRIIRHRMERWHDLPLKQQEAIFGRQKTSGAPLGTQDQTEHFPPLYFDDEQGKVTPFSSHIRLSNPREPGNEAHLMLRRPFNYVNGVRPDGELDLGLLFICYQADLEQSFITVQRRLDGEPLEAFVQPVGGGFFFTLPGITHAQDYLGRTLIAAAS